MRYSRYNKCSYERPSNCVLWCQSTPNYNISVFCCLKVTLFLTTLWWTLKQRFRYQIVYTSHCLLDVDLRVKVQGF